MTRIHGGYIARRTKFGSSFRRSLTQQKIRALVSADRDRHKKKRHFRGLWITRINAGIREMKLFYSYSKWIHDLYKRQVLMNRKMLSQMALFHSQYLSLISNEITYSGLI
nr:ribosomal protein L20 [Incarvillea compacta]